MGSLSKSKNEITIDDIIASAKKYIDNDEQLDVIKQAYIFAKDKHEGQDRKSVV